MMVFAHLELAREPSSRSPASSTALHGLALDGAASQEGRSKERWTVVSGEFSSLKVYTS